MQSIKKSKSKTIHRHFSMFFPLLFFCFVLAPSTIGQIPLWGPEEFERGTGEPVTDTILFSAPNANGEYTIFVQNGEPESRRVSSASISFNGEEVMGPNDFNQQVSEITVPIGLLIDNEMEITVAGIPGSGMTVSIYGPDSTSLLISPQGGSIELIGYASVEFPPGSFNSETQIYLLAASNPDVEVAYEVARAKFSAGPRLPYEIYINTGSSPPLEDFNVTIFPTDEFLTNLGTDFNIAAFVRVYQDAGMGIYDHFEYISSEFDPESVTISMTVPKWIVTNKRNQENTFDVVILCGSISNY